MNSCLKIIVLKEISDVIPINNLGRKISLDFNIILDAIYFVLEHGAKWKSVKLFGISKSSVFRYFQLWNKYNIFKNVWHKLLFANKNKITYDMHHIDGSLIKSIFGYDCIGPNPTDRGRNATKLSLLGDNNGIPLSAVFSKGNVNDCKLFEETITNKPKFIKQRMYLCADRGYIGKNLKKIARKNNYKLLTPVKMNRKKKSHYLNLAEKNILKNRYKIERSFSWIDNYRRLLVRYDKKITNYIGFNYLCFSCIVFNKFNK
jgi:putative transposase